MKKAEWKNWLMDLQKRWEVPGFAMALVQGGEIIFLEALGQRDINNQKPMMSKTIMRIGSCTKAFTATALACLVAEGKLDWDEPLKKIIPGFEMKNLIATELVTLRDVLSHRTGLPGHDLLWFLNNFNSREDLIGKIKFLELNKSPRSEFQYNNLMYAVGGYIIEKISGLSWENFLTEKILKPIGMDNTVLSIQEMEKMKNHSLPYSRVEGEIKQVPSYSHEIVGGPCGGINSCIEDLVKWLLFNLEQGKANKEEIIPWNTLQEIYKPLVLVPIQSEFKELGDFHYGLGWGVRPYRGIKQICHFGGIDGFTAYTGLFPERNTGIAILANSDSAEVINFINTIVYSFVDDLFGLEKINWEEIFLRKIEENEKTSEQKKEDKKTPKPPSSDLEDFTGIYNNPAYGRIRISREGEELKLISDRESFNLKHAISDIFSFEIEKWRLDFPISFRMNSQGKIVSLSIPLEPRVKEITFDKRKNG